MSRRRTNRGEDQESESWRSSFTTTNPDVPGVPFFNRVSQFYNQDVVVTEHNDYGEKYES
jgi:hypothetical protein